MLGQLLLQHSDSLSMALQSQSMSTLEGQKIACTTVCTIESMRSDESFKLFWKKVTDLAGSLDVNNPTLPRQRKRPRGYETGLSDSSFPQTVEELYGIAYFEALDLLLSAIKSRIDQPGYHVYSKLEELVLKAANKESFEEELKFLIDFYKDDLNEDQLRVQLDILGSNIPTEAKPHNLSSILEYVRGLSCLQKALMSEVCVLVSLIIVMPATNATSERSFSALRTVTLYLKSTMTQTRLTSIMILSTHKHSLISWT